MLALNDAQSLAACDRFADAYVQLSNGAGLVSGQRLFHLHCFKHNNQFACFHAFAVALENFHDGALHRAVDRIARNLVHGRALDAMSLGDRFWFVELNFNPVTIDLGDDAT